MSFRKSLIIHFSFFFLGVFLTLIVIFLTYTDPSNEFKETRSNKPNYKFINPLLECDSTAISQNTNLNKLRNTIQSLINSQIEAKNISFAAIYYRDLNNGPWFGINEKELFSPASLVKVPLMISYLKLSESQPDLLQKQLTNIKEFNPQEQNIQSSEHLMLNQTYTVENLLSRMIIDSDNLAYELLLNNIDNNLVVQTYTDLGVDISKGLNNPSGNILTVKDYASFFRILFNSSYLNKQNSESALSLLSQVKFNKALPAGLPSNITIAHKFGERQYLATGEKQFHDCGIVYLPEKPYLICIMTRGQDFNYLTNTIKDISATIYSSLSQKN